MVTSRPTVSPDPLTTQGDLIVRDASASVRLGVGADGEVLTADAAETEGIKWAPMALDHVDLGLLGADDHTQYVLADGSRNLANGTASNLTSTGGVETVTAVGSSATMTLDMDAGPRHNMNTQDENTTLALSNAATGKSASAALKQGAGGGFTINVPGGWIPAITPSPTTNAGEWNFVEVWQDGSDVFYTLKGQV